jgi:hypothetical protein
MKNNKIYLFRDRDDYVKKITKDNIFNITGEKGSGKSYFGDMKDVDKNVVIHLDPVFLPVGSKEHGDSSKVREILIHKYGDKINPDKYFEKDYYKDIIKYIGNKEGYIEGGSIAEIQDISIIKGTVIVKRTGVFKCFIRTIKRDYHNEYFMNEEIKKHGKFIAKFTRLHKVIKRRKKIFKTYHNIEDFINRLEKYR